MVSFYWREADDYMLGGVPVDLTEDLDQFYRVMKGTHKPSPRCIALEGNVGIDVHCNIYEKRASVCREFEPSFLNGVRNERCDKARIAHGLKPLSPDDWKHDGFTNRPAA